MSEFKFACPMCGQHIKCDSAESRTEVDCPTCFQKLVVPEAPQGDATKLILNAALANARRYKPSDTKFNATVPTRPTARRFPVLAIVLLVCAAGTAFAIRQKIMKGAQETTTTAASGLVAAPDDTNWTLDLTSVAIPAGPVAGRIHGRAFNPPRIVFQGDALNFRQGAKHPPELGSMIAIFINGGRELAGKSITITTNDASAPKVVLHWRDGDGQSVTETYHKGYAMRLEFNPLYGTHLTGRVYFSAPDESKSYVAGTFDAEVLPPAPAKARIPRKPMAVR